MFTRFPFGLFSKSLLIEDDETLLVYPPVDRLSLPGSAEDAARDGETREWELAGSSPVAAGLRSFVPGDPRRRIHWQASQRAGSLLVRDLESECDQEVRVRLHTGGRPGAGFEGRVRRAASEVVALLDAGRRVGLDAGGRAVRSRVGRGPPRRACSASWRGSSPAPRRRA